MGASEALVPAIGTPIHGGHFAGRIRVNDILFGLVAAPRDPGQISATPWITGRKKDVVGARSYFDGLANTQAMAAAGSKLAEWALDLRIGDCADWYIPSRDELELLYRAFKPTTRENYTWRSGDNPSSVPAGYPYESQAPAQTALEAFREGGAEAFTPDWYWASTRSSEGDAWSQDFGDGYQGYDGKSWKAFARAVRRFPL